MRKGRRGVASIIGTLIFVMVFLLALGAQAYASMLQAQSSEAVEQAQRVGASRGQEALQYGKGAGGLTATNSGPTTLVVNHVILKFSNGTVYPLTVSATVPTAGDLSVQTLIPGGVCSPGTATCLAKYNQIVSGNSPGSEVGLLTSYGNTFWYVPEADSSSSPTRYYRTSSLQSTASNTFSPIPGLSFSGAAGSGYLVSMYLGYYQSAATSGGITFAISPVAGATFLACGGVYLPDASVTCTTAPDTSLGPTTFGGDLVFSANYCYGSAVRCMFVATVMVSFSSSGTFQLEWEVAAPATGYLTANSFIAVTPVQ